MRHLLIGFFLFSTGEGWAPADDRPAANINPQVKDYEALKKECDAAVESWNQELRAAYAKAEKEGKQKTFSFEEKNPNEVYAPRFLALAEKDPTGPAAFRAIESALYGSGWPKDSDPTWRGGMKLLSAYYLKSPEIKRLLTFLAMFREDGDALIHKVIAQNPDRQLQARGYLVLINARNGLSAFLDKYKNDPKERARVEKLVAKDKLVGMLAKAEQERGEVDEFRKILRDHYAEFAPDLEVGQQAPEVISEDLRGNITRLSDLRGKVVVIDVWATWCGPCKSMIPHERKMVSRLEGKAFALVSISVDEEKKTLTNFLAKETMPWTHWWSGPDGKAVDTLSVVHFPTIFVLDAQGVIRFKEIRGEELETAVNVLLEEMELKKTAAK
jgi:thiol-disulfide isomerase/thioredoxin